jgi:CTP:molybdopterin cytidylyltransferase MocA
MHVFAVVLAAGQGLRIGRPKALLPLHDGNFLTTCAALLARPGVASVVAVLGCEAARVATAAPGLATVVNPSFREGMLSSVLRGLEAAAAAGADAILLHPVDHPLVDPATVDRVLAALEAGAVIAVPSHDGRRGHPAGFARLAWPALRGAPAEWGARAVLLEHPEWVVHVPGDPGCVAGIDTREEFERLLGPLSP